jgi:hypothetical protein
MARRAMASNPRVGGGYSTLSASGDTSATTFGTWTVFQQSIDGMWNRQFQYKSTPTVGSAGVVSGAPQIDLTYCDTQVTVTCKQQFVDASYASGFAQNQAITYDSDSSLGGYGLSGIFTTSSVGETRKVKVNTDEEFTHSYTFNTNACLLPGAYNGGGTLDTSGQFNGDFYTNVIIPASQQSPYFKPSLVDI